MAHDESRSFRITRVSFRRLTLLAAALAGGCSHATPSPTPTATSATPCSVAVAGQDLSAWQLVKANEGFSLCVPPTWRVGRSSATTAGASVSWGVGQHPRTEVQTVTVTMPVRDIPEASAPADADVRRFTEDIDGSSADIWRNRFGSTYYTGAQWAAPRAWIVGSAGTSEIADVEITIIRTMRFIAR